MTSNDLKLPQKVQLVKTDSKPDSVVKCTTNKRSKVKCGSVLEVGEVNDECLDENLHNNNL